MIKRLTWITFSIIVTSIGYAPQILAHSSNITYQKIEVMQVTAKYDNDQPMMNAQVVIYAPNNPSKIWGKGSTDEQGQFLFNPDRKITGNWTVKVRVAGHGQIITIPIKESSLIDNNEEESQQNKNSVMSQSNFTKLQTNETNPLQKLVIAVTGVWGFVGTALFFSRKNG